MVLLDFSTTIISSFTRTIRSVTIIVHISLIRFDISENRSEVVVHQLGGLVETFAGQTVLGRHSPTDRH